jgi:hypothetical protein
LPIGIAFAYDRPIGHFKTKPGECVLRTKIQFARACVVSQLAVVGLLLLLPLHSAADEEAPSIAKDSLQVTPFTLGVFHNDFDKWSWVPKVTFRVNGPIASGSQLYLSFDVPGAPPVKFDCPTPVTSKGRWVRVECGGREVPEDKGTTYTGPVNFGIHMRNELAGNDATLFTGKAKVAKVHSNEHGPKAVNKFVYYVDHDWNIPIGYIFLEPDELSGWDLPIFKVAFWIRGEAGKLEPHLFFAGKEVGKLFSGSMEVGAPSCDAEIENGTSQFVDDSVPQKAKWQRILCTFNNVRGWDKTGKGPGMFGSMYSMAKNPGDYEIKVLWKNHLARSVKFSVTAEGKFDNGIAAANKLGSSRTIVPMQIIGDQDGPWNRAAWKTDAFYGHPLSGFTALP